MQNAPSLKPSLGFNSSVSYIWWPVLHDANPMYAPILLSMPFSLGLCTDTLDASRSNRGVSNPVLCTFVCMSVPTSVRRLLFIWFIVGCIPVAVHGWSIHLLWLAVELMLVTLHPSSNMFTLGHATIGFFLPVLSPPTRYQRECAYHNVMTHFHHRCRYPPPPLLRCYLAMG